MDFHAPQLRRREIMHVGPMWNVPYVQCWNYKNLNGRPVFASEASEKKIFRPLLGAEKVDWL